MKGLGTKLAFGWLLLIGTTAVAGPAFFENTSRFMDFQNALQGPSVAHLFGTDALGRDVLARVVCGASASLGVAIGAIALSTLIGVFLGLLPGVLGTRADRAVVTLTDLALCFPSFFLLLSVVAVLGPGTQNLILILGLTGWMSTTRLVRAETLSLREREFVLAARVSGAGPLRVMFRHLLPNLMGLIAANAVLSFSGFILAETGLSFLGFGIQPPVPSWGNILSDARASIGVAWWMTFFPGLFIFITALSANSLGEALGEQSGS